VASVRHLDITTSSSGPDNASLEQRTDPLPLPTSCLRVLTLSSPPNPLAILFILRLSGSSSESSHFLSRVCRLPISRPPLSLSPVAGAPASCLLAGIFRLVPSPSAMNYNQPPDILHEDIVSLIGPYSSPSITPLSSCPCPFSSSTVITMIDALASWSHCEGEGR